MSTCIRKPALVVVLASVCFAPLASAQSRTAVASQHSVAALSQSRAAVVELVEIGGRFSVTAIRPTGGVTHVSLTSAAEGGAFVIQVGAEIVAATGVAVGSIVEAVAVKSGHLLLVGGRALAFVPNQPVAEMMHRAEWHR
jgi:hypothetical protein